MRKRNQDAIRRRVTSSKAPTFAGGPEGRLLSSLTTNPAAIRCHNLGVDGPLFAFRADLVTDPLEARARNPLMVGEREMTHRAVPEHPRRALIVKTHSLFLHNAGKMELFRLRIGVVKDLVGKDACVLKQLKAVVESIIDCDPCIQLNADLGLTPG